MPDPIALPRGPNGTGIASLLFGALALLVGWIPVLGLLSLPLAGLAILLGLIGLAVALGDRRTGLGTPIAGLVTGLLAIVLALLSTAILGWWLGSPGQPDRRPPPREEAPSPVAEASSPLPPQSPVPAHPIPAQPPESPPAPDDDWPETLLHRGDTLRAAGLPRAALRHFRRVADLFPAAPEARIARARIAAMAAESPAP